MSMIRPRRVDGGSAVSLIMVSLACATSPSPTSEQRERVVSPSGPAMKVAVPADFRVSMTIMMQVLHYTVTLDSAGQVTFKAEGIWLMQPQRAAIPAENVGQIWVEYQRLALKGSSNFRTHSPRIQIDGFAADARQLIHASFDCCGPARERIDRFAMRVEEMIGVYARRWLPEEYRVTGQPCEAALGRLIERGELSIDLHARETYSGGAPVEVVLEIVNTTTQAITISSLDTPFRGDQFGPLWG
jgi:hypothetical protein